MSDRATAGRPARNAAPRSDQFRGLTKGKGKALEALGVEALAEDEVSRPVRVRGSRALHQRLQKMNAREIGEVLERVLGER